MKILSAPPPLPDQEVTCPRCKAVLAVTNADVESVEHRDGLCVESLPLRGLFDTVDVREWTRAGYVYQFHCAACGAQLRVRDNLYGPTVEQAYSFD